MKLAASLALVLTLALAIWAASDFNRNEQEKKYAIEALQREISRELSGFSPSSVSENRLKDIAAAEQLDGGIAILSACALIASVVLFSRKG